MNINKLLSNAVKLHNFTAQDMVIWSSQCEDITMYFIYCKDSNIWDKEECKLFLYLYDKLSQERIYPVIRSLVFNGMDKIGIYIVVKS